MSTTATSRRTFSPRAVAPFAAVTIVLPHMPSFFHRLLDGDEAIYGSIAALMNIGGPLYAEGGVDNKPPGIFWVYSATFRVFGTYQMTAIHVVALLAVIATALLIFLVGRHVGSTRAGVLAAIFYGVMTGAGSPRPSRSCCCHWLSRTSSRAPPAYDPCSCSRAGSPPAFWQAPLCSP